MVNSMFNEMYKALNKEQKLAVDTIEGPVMVVAGPGTGKTTILTLRIANILLRTDTPPSGILALTFTEAGVKAMKMKLREIIGSRADEVNTHTFHGFAAHVINEFQDHFPQLYRSKQITDIESESLLREILTNKTFSKLRPLGEPDFYIYKILDAISTSKREAWEPNRLEAFSKKEIENIQNSDVYILKRGARKGSLNAEGERRIEKCKRTILMSQVYSEYEKHKKTRRQIDFDDLIFELLRALQNDKLLLSLLQEKFLYIHLDEHQDSNGAQNTIVKLIADYFDSPNLFVVGDDKQAIYRFQGASIENFLRFRKHWKLMKLIELINNYRSEQGILDASHTMIEQNYGDLTPLYSSLKNETRPVSVVVAGNRDAEDKYLISELKGILGQKPYKTVAVIVRRNRDVEKLLSLCEESNIPAAAEREANIFSRPVGRLFFSLIEYIDDPSRTDSLAQTIAGGLWNLSFKERASLLRTLRRGELDEVFKKIPQIEEINKQIINSGIINFPIILSELAGLSMIALRKPLDIEVWRGIYTLWKVISNEKNIEDIRELMNELLQYKKSAEKRVVKVKSGTLDAPVTIMTAHGSKGLEFDYVFIPYANEDSWIRRGNASYFVFPKEKEVADDLRDERRLFYVALTRARRQVTISYALQDLQRILLPLRFIEELDPKAISQKNIPAWTDIPRTSISRISNEDHEIIEYTKRDILQNGISVTALNHFLDCPNKFLFQSILRVPGQLTPSLARGNAMHLAMDNVWQLKSKSEKEITKSIKSSIAEYMSSSNLAKNESEQILTELLESAPIIAASLQNHFSQPGSSRAEVKAGMVYDFEYKRKKNLITLHGKLDVIIENENKISVFDYKTKEGMSEAAIRGETKSDDGNYFRQLVFYKMLLEGNRRYNGKTIVPALVFIKPNKYGKCPIVEVPVLESDIDNVKKEINSLLASVWAGNLLNSTCDDPNCKYCGYRSLL